MRTSTGGITRSPSVGAVGLSSSPSFPPRSLNTAAGLSSSASTSRLQESHQRPFSPDELDSDRDLPSSAAVLPPQPRKVVGKLSGAGLPEKAIRKVANGAAVVGSSRAGPSTPDTAASTSAARRMTGAPLKSSRKVKGPNDKEDGSKERVVVCVRAKPPIPTACIYDFAPADNLLTLNDLHPTNVKRGGITKGREQEGVFPIDHLHLPPTSTSELYQKLVAPIVTKTVEGFNGTVFAYGMTGSGKTHTMGGVEDDPGVIPRSIDQIFDSIDDDKERAFFLRVSYLELYNESLRDLLNPNSKLVPTIHERDGRVCVDNLEEVPVRNPEEVQLQLKKGENNRRVGKTDFNEHSSRSHTVFSIIIESRLIADSTTSPTIPQSPSLDLPPTASALSLVQLATNSGAPKPSSGGGVVRLSRLNLIDLAGSEKATSDGDRQKEGGFINKSLLELANVIEKLTEAKPQAHIPYRNSKLTRLLQDSLSGHARIAVICTISLQDQHAYEALATLKFARRVSCIVTQAKRGLVHSGDALMEYYRTEIADLRRQLAAANAQARGPAISTLSDDSSDDDHDDGLDGPSEETRQARLQELNAARVQHEEDVQRLQMERTKLQSQISNMAGFILTSEAAPQSPAGPAFGAFKGKSRRRISDTSLGLGRPLAASANAKRFVSAMTAVEEGPAAAEARQSFISAPMKPAAPSITLAEHEVAVTALRAQLEAASTESAARVAAEAQSADARAKVEDLLTTISDLCARETAAIEASTASDKAQAELVERITALEAKFADEERRRQAVEADVEVRAQAQMDLEAQLLATEAATKEAQQMLAIKSEEAAVSLTNALADQATQYTAELHGLHSQLAELVTAHEAALAVEKSRLADFQDNAAQRLNELEETLRGEITSRQARVTELEMAVEAAETKAQEQSSSAVTHRSEAAARQILIAELEAQLAEAEEVAQCDREEKDAALAEKEAALAAETVALHVRITELEAKISAADELEERTSALAESQAAALATSLTRVAELEAEASVAQAAAEARETESAETHAANLSASEARVIELQARIDDVEEAAKAREEASSTSHAAALAATESRIAEYEAKLKDAEETARARLTESVVAHETVVSSLQDQVSALERQAASASATAERAMEDVENAHTSARHALQVQIDTLEAQLSEVSSAAELRRSSLEEAHLVATTTLQTRVCDLETKLNAADAIFAEERSRLEKEHASYVSALEIRLADEHSSALSSAIKDGSMKLAAATATHETEQGTLHSRLVEVEAVIRASDEAHSSELSSLRAQLVEEHKTALARTQEDGSTALAAQAETHASECAALQSRLAELEDAVETSAVKAASQQADLLASHTAKMTSLQVKLADLEKAQSETQAALAASKEALETSVPRSIHDSEVVSLSTRLADLQATAANDKAALEQALLEERSAAEGATDTMREALVEQATLLQRLHQTELKALIAHSTELEASVAAHDGAVQSELAQAQQALSDAQQALQDADRRQALATEEQKQALAAAVDAARSETAAALEKTHASTTRDLQTQVTNLQSSFVDLQVTHQAELDVLRTAHAQAVAVAEAAQATRQSEFESFLATVSAEKVAVESRLAEVTVKLGDQAHLLSLSAEELENERQAGLVANRAAEAAASALTDKTAELQAVLDEKAQLVANQAAAAAERASAQPQWMGMTKSPSIAEGLNLAHTGSLRETRRPGHSHNLSFAEPSRLLPAGSPQDEEIHKLNQTIKIQKDIIVDLQEKVRIWGEQARKNDRVINELHDEIRSGRVPNVQALSNKWTQSSTHAPQSPWESLHKRSTHAALAAAPATPSRPAHSSLRQSALSESSQSNQASPRTPVQTPSTPKRHVVNTYIPSTEKPPPLPHASHQHSNSAARAARRVTIEHDINALKGTSKVEQSRSVFDSPVKTPTSKSTRKL